MIPLLVIGGGLAAAVGLDRALSQRQKNRLARGGAAPSGGCHRSAANAPDAVAHQASSTRNTSFGGGWAG